MRKQFFSGVAIWLFFLPWIFGDGHNSYSSSSVIEFPELKQTCIYGDCILQPPRGVVGTNKCIVSDSNYGRVVVKRVFFECEEFLGKTITWSSGEQLMISTVVKVEKTY